MARKRRQNEKTGYTICLVYMYTTLSSTKSIRLLGFSSPVIRWLRRFSTAWWGILWWGPQRTCTFHISSVGEPRCRIRDTGVRIGLEIFSTKTTKLSTRVANYILVYLKKTNSAWGAARSWQQGLHFMHFRRRILTVRLGWMPADADLIKRFIRLKLPVFWILCVQFYIVHPRPKSAWCRILLRGSGFTGREAGRSLSSTSTSSSSSTKG